MNILATLRANNGHNTTVGYDFNALFGDLAKRGQADVAIVSTEAGFSPLGASGSFFERDLGLSYEREIRALADWNRFDNDRVTLIAIASRRPDSALKGVILAPGGNTRSYARFVQSEYGKPSRDFYYNVSYEAFAHACDRWGARQLAISHLSSSGQYHEDIATCHAEALGHYCDANPSSAPESFIFCGCCITPEHLQGIRRLNAEGQTTKYHPISVEEERRGNAVLLRLDW